MRGAANGPAQLWSEEGQRETGDSRIDSPEACYPKPYNGEMSGLPKLLPSHQTGRSEMKARLQVMKFGGTSVGDASCIARAAQIMAQAARENGCVAVVSAMSGVTNRLVEAARNAQAGNNGDAAAVVDALRRQHEAALTSLIQREEERARIRQKMEEVLAEGRRLCEGTALLRELTPRTLDAISSLGERLSAPLVAAAIRELGVPSESIEATELIVTDAVHGGAETQMEFSRGKVH